VIRRDVARTLAGFATVVVANLGCAGDGPSLEDYRASAGEVCLETQREADALALPTAGPGLSDALRQSAELSRDEVEALIDLPKPTERRDDVEAWLEALGRRVTALEAYSAQLLDTTSGAPPPVPEELAVATQDAAEAAIALGLEACGAGVDTPISAAPTPTPESPEPGPTADPGGPPTVTNDIGIPPEETTTQDQ
jgi:hypothetical protein